MASAVRKAIFPVAGLGTRFLPATKAVPKELLPVVDRPLIDYAINEARAAGIEEFIFITGRLEALLRAHLSMPDDLEAALAAKDMALARALRAAEIAPAAIHCVPQGVARGLGHAVNCARALVGEEPFAVLLPDDLMDCDPPCIGQLIEVHKDTGGNVVAVEQVPRELTRRYGVLDIASEDGRRVEVRGLVEKPAPDDAPSTLSIVGRYVLLPGVFDFLAREVTGAGGEIQLTDAVASMIGTAPVHGFRFQGRRYDCGSRHGYVEAQIGMALRHDNIRETVLRSLRAASGDWE